MLETDHYCYAADRGLTTSSAHALSRELFEVFKVSVQDLPYLERCIDEYFGTYDFLISLGSKRNQSFFMGKVLEARPRGFEVRVSCGEPDSHIVVRDPDGWEVFSVRDRCFEKALMNSFTFLSKL